ncbi:C4-dicarboxylate transporter DctA [Microvirgula curvata]|uniref:C4-dicarboxylate transporter DctA n=1 Tax=Microvirgula aerodenitrificans TaxID=57480 RepID=A0A2S0PD03_9NEIS|nr:MULTISPECIES: C4-dicarboxylate transporter DctA [Microvirgula]AVY95147.1 C4-dicarboxylate transporter DctA [Microvirgula aerodenitrificans]RAS10632.1 Na+/H+-dicarboxylate symporter [Microvirgula sp. AG722]
MKRLCRSLFAQVLVALVAGILIGVFYPDFAISLHPLGEGFIKLIRMLVGLVVFAVVVSGIANAGELKKVGKVGLTAIVYFELVTTLALALGIALAYLLQPGHGMNVDVSALNAGVAGQYLQSAHQVTDSGSVAFLMKIIPDSVFSAFARNDVLQILLIAILFGCSLSLMGEKGRNLTALVDSFSTLLFGVMGFIIKLAPLGVLGSVAFTVGEYGYASLLQLGYLVGTFYLAVTLFILVVLGTILRIAGFSIVQLIRYLREEILVVLGTASSDCVLPQVMCKLERLGISKPVVGLVIPTGYSFNLDAFSIYLTLAAVFIAQATNTPLSLTDLLGILLIALVTSKGAHGIPGSAIVILSATLASHPSIPAVGLVLVLSVDWFIGIGRAAGNLIGNCVATVVVAVWSKAIDHQRAHEVLSRPAAPVDQQHC